MAIKKDTLDGLLAGRDPQAEIFAKDGLFDEAKESFGGARFEGGDQQRPSGGQRRRRGSATAVTVIRRRGC